jgi:hypothetical protein
MKKKVWRKLPGAAQAIAVVINTPQRHSMLGWVDIEQPGGDRRLPIADCRLRNEIHLKLTLNKAIK